MPGESREDRISWQDQRLAAVRRKRENMVESVVANATLGGLLGTFVGYMAGSAVGVATWNLKNGMLYSTRGLAAGFLIGALFNGGLTIQQHRQMRKIAQDLSPSTMRPPTMDELMNELDMLREKERTEGVSLDSAKARLKEQIRTTADAQSKSLK